MSVPASLRSQDMDVLWSRIRDRLEAHPGSRGRLRLPELPSGSQLVLKSLLDRPPRSTLDLAALEAALVRRGVGQDLESALAALGHPISSLPQQRRAERSERKRARQDARELAAQWPEPWAGKWMEEVIRAGILKRLDRTETAALLQRIRSVLNHLDERAPAPISRVDLAARVLGSSHALDTGTREEAAVARALQYKIGPSDHRDLWAQAGVHLDLTSAPVLTWRLPLSQGSGLAQLTQDAQDAGIPLHLSRFALEKYPAKPSPGSRVLVVENPRIVEAAAQMKSEAAVISTNGNPGSAVLLLLTQLREAGTQLDYHGDFDTAGLAICERMMRFGLSPWRMDAKHYQAALLTADQEGASLPKERQSPGPTPWDPLLQPLFDRERRVVHEERLLPGLIE